MDKDSFILGFFITFLITLILAGVYFGQLNIDKQKGEYLLKAVDTVVTQCGGDK